MMREIKITSNTVAEIFRYLSEEGMNLNDASLHLATRLNAAGLLIIIDDEMSHDDEKLSRIIFAQAFKKKTSNRLIETKIRRVDLEEV